MKIYNSSDFVDVIDITLFKYNHYDNLIWTKCLNQLDYMRVDGESILVTPYQLQTLFEYNFEKEIRRIKAITFELIHKDASSLFFIHKIVEDFERLKWIKLTLSKRRNFSRMVEDYEKTSRQIKYSYKIVRTTIRLNEFLELSDIRKINVFLKESGFFKQKPYENMSMRHLALTVEGILGTKDMSDQTAEALSAILDIIDPKMEGDNPEVMLVTDW